MRQTRSTRVVAQSVGSQALAADVARRFFLDGDSKVKIAADLGINRFKVARVLEAARTNGLVRIHISAPDQIDTVLAADVADRFGLSSAIVMVDQPEWAEPDRQDESGPLGAALGRLAADYVQEVTSSEDVIGLAWGHSMSALSSAWSEPVAATFVQLAGAIARTDMPQSAPDLVRATAAAAGGEAAFYYAPIVMPDSGSAAALRQQIGVREAFTRLDHLTKAVISIGAWAAGQSTVHDGLERADQRLVRQAGAVAEITGLLLDRDGTVLDVLADRVVAIDEDQLRRTPHVIALAAGAKRHQAVNAALRSGMINTLITHTSLAKMLLKSR